MGVFKKKTDPISERARALSDEIAALEAQIRKLAGNDQIDVMLDNIGLPYSGINIALSDSASEPGGSGGRSRAAAAGGPGSSRVRGGAGFGLRPSRAAASRARPWRASRPIQTSP